MSSTGFRSEGSCISPIFRVDIQHVLPCSQNPLGRYGDEPEDKSLYATRFLEPESFGIKSAHDVLVEIPPNGMSFSDFICIFAMSCYDFCLISNRNTKLSEKSDMTKS